MNSHLAEVLTETGFEEVAHGWGQWPSTAFQGTNLGCQAGTYLGNLLARPFCLNELFFLFFLFRLDLSLD
jgi:hypothetical protein